MPYRAELKRPDLKGSFPCSVCDKIFCHSSSLSRHRMQAHFKSYTCTQCSQEISNNETLRSHMFRSHSISRLFMCRCCNWAFPDKTSLHIHMQSMNKFGTPGEVAVLARSSSHDPDDHNSHASGAFLPHTSKHVLPQAKSLPSSIFPTLFSQDNLFKNNKKSTAELTAPQNWLNHWLHNNPLAHLGLQNMQALGGKMDQKLDEQSVEINESDYDELEVTTTEEDLKEEEEEMAEQAKKQAAEERDRVIVKLNAANGQSVKSHKRKSNEHMNVDDGQTHLDIEKDDDEPKLKLPFLEKQATEQPSPTASDSHISDSHTSNSSTAPDSPPTKCFHCQIAKGKLTLSERKIEEYEHKIRELQAAIETLQRHSSPLELSAIHKFPAHNSHVAAFAPFLSPPTPTPPSPVTATTSSPSIFMPNNAFTQNLVQNNAFKMLFTNFMQAQLNKRQC